MALLAQILAQILIETCWKSLTKEQTDGKKQYAPPIALVGGHNNDFVPIYTFVLNIRTS